VGWSDRLGLITDEQVESYVEAVYDRVDADRKREKEEPLPPVAEEAGT
jgi:hypothetical protein